MPDFLIRQHIRLCGHRQDSILHHADDDSPDDDASIADATGAELKDEDCIYSEAKEVSTAGAIVSIKDEGYLIILAAGRVAAEGPAATITSDSSAILPVWPPYPLSGGTNG